MLDALLASVRGFGGRDAVRDVTYERNMLLLGGVGDREIGSAAEDRLNFDEVDALRDKRLDVIGRLRGVGDDDRRLKGWGIAVEVGTGKENLGAEPLPFPDFFAQRNQRLKVAAHIADCCNPVGEKQWQEELATATRFARSRKMQVKVGEAGDQEFPGRVYDLGVAR